MSTFKIRIAIKLTSVGDNGVKSEINLKTIFDAGLYNFIGRWFCRLLIKYSYKIT